MRTSELGSPIYADRLLDRDWCDVWEIPLIVRASLLADWRKTVLDSSECARADRFASEPLGDRFVVARAALRTILSAYLEARPSAHRFAYAPGGKPSLADRASAIHFNLGHANNIALIAVSSTDVGVDLEVVRDIQSLGSFVDRIGTPRERALICHEPICMRTFFRLWTLKEAVIKATGVGITADLQALELSDALYAADAPAALEVDGRAVFASSLPMGGKAVAALATLERWPAVRRLCARFPSDDGAMAISTR